MSPDPPLNPQPPPSAPQASAPPDFQPGSSAPPLTPPVDSSPLRRILPALLAAAAVLGLLLVLLFVILPRVSQVPRPARSPLPSPSAAVLPPADPAPPEPTPPVVPTAQALAAGQPLSVTLYSAGGGKHVPVGKPVLISAYAALPSAGSATIAIAYTRNGGPRSLLALAQGSLSTASWTPSAPGHYDFSATASDSRKISVISRHLTIDADAPRVAVKPLPPPVVSPAPPPVETASVRAVRVHRPVPSRSTARIVPQRLAPKPYRQAPHSKAYHSKVYHVAAAAFVARPLAETFAGALRRRGFHAFVRVTKQPHHKPAYAVETGDFLHSPDAQKQVETLKHDGYPAFASQGH